MKRLMMLIIIVGILTAIAVPLYTGYVEKRRGRETISIINGIVRSQEIEKRNAGKYYSASITPKFFTYKTAPTPDGDGFTITIIPKDPAGDPLILRYPPDYTEPHLMLWIEPIEP